MCFTPSNFQTTIFNKSYDFLTYEYNVSFCPKCGRCQTKTRNKNERRVKQQGYQVVWTLFFITTCRCRNVQHEFVIRRVNSNLSRRHLCHKYGPKYTESKERVHKFPKWNRNRPVSNRPNKFENAHGERM